jgi:hypothetical protein
MRKFYHLLLERRTMELLMAAICFSMLDTEEEADAEMLLCGLALQVFTPFPRPVPHTRHCATIDSLSTHYAITHFRFSPSNLRRLLIALHIPPLISCGEPGHTHSFRGEEGLLLLLRRGVPLPLGGACSRVRTPRGRVV